MMRPFLAPTALALTALTLTALTMATPVFAQATAGQPPSKIRSVTLTGNQKCPVSTVPDEVIVCARVAPGEQYRIPKEVRNEGPIEQKDQSFAAKQDRLDEVGRAAGGLPDSCSPVGTGGQTGCTQQLLQRSAADKQDGSIRRQPSPHIRAVRRPGRCRPRCRRRR